MFGKSPQQWAPANVAQYLIHNSKQCVVSYNRAVLLGSSARHEGALGNLYPIHSEPQWSIAAIPAQCMMQYFLGYDTPLSLHQNRHLQHLVPAEQPMHHPTQHQHLSVRNPHSDHPCQTRI